MKKILPLFLAAILLLTGCKAKNYTPELPLNFKQNAVVTSGDFSFECEICKNEENVAVTVMSTKAKGLVMTFDGKLLDFSYDNFSHQIDGTNFENSNAAIVVYQVIEAASAEENIIIRKVDGGYKYEGRIAYGDFIMLQSDDNSLKSISFRNRDLIIEFINQ